MLIEVHEQSQTGDARRKALALAEHLELGEVRRGRVAIAATELATNLIKHAGKGHILVQELRQNGDRGIRVIGVDKGPGISDVSLALRDGHSTSDSLGTGLGAIRRLSDVFDLYTVPGSGTVVDAEFWEGTRRSHAGCSVIEAACLSEPIKGEYVNGDGWAARSTSDFTFLMVVDGLGHGVLAAEAAREAERLMAASPSTSPEEILREVHLALKKTRGAAGAVARIDPRKGLLSFAGVGNISGAVVAPSTYRSLVSHNGTLGHELARVQEFTAPWNQDSVLIMHSDGLATKWDLARYPGIFNKAPTLIAAVLHRDFCRGRDDVTVLVAKASRAAGDQL